MKAVKKIKEKKEIQVKKKNLEQLQPTKDEKQEKKEDKPQKEADDTMDTDDMPLLISDTNSDDSSKGMKRKCIVNEKPTKPLLRKKLFCLKPVFKENFMD